MVVDRNIHIPSFNGTEHASAWFEIFEELCHVQNVRSTRRKMAYLVSHLKGTAFTWYLGRRALAIRTKDKRKMSYQHLKQAIVKKWDGNPELKVRALKQVRCKGTSAQAISTFAADFEEKYHAVEDEMTAREVKDIFIRKLPADL